ncbi:PREDICTED: uncharacterized protein C17orf80 homolog [Sturnus vulgaris]|uniref:uncharacterized protein C17orf80 homolog n=1 Tax=Sturnus vulgaris TaxID=9172 RepID=UPI00071A5810|nr:PREDICTED: uncharacterized protein C17orf80 homolog [Sturnus vulgaris]
MAAGTELCPHCQRPFKRLRAHLPHCKAAPAPGTSPRPGPGTGSAPGSAPGASPERSPGTGSASPAPQAVPGSSPGAGPGSPGSRSRAVQDVARSLDLHPEEVEDVPKKLQKGVKVVIQKHRARVVREKEPRSRAGAAGSAGEGTEPGLAPQRRKTAQKSKSKETPSQGAVGSGTGSSKGEKKRLKATKELQGPPESRNSPGDLTQQEGKDNFTAGEEQVHLKFGVGSKPPVDALRPKNLQLSLTGQGTSKNELSSPQRLRDSGERVEGVTGLVLNVGRAPELALLHTPKIQPSCSAQASGRSARAGAMGLEWFPDLYPDGEGLRIFPGKRFHEDARITAEIPKGGFTQGQPGPLWERPLMEVRLGELHTWISTCNFSPQGLLGAAQKAWSSYCAKYIHVKQGGPAGISMLLAGYCLLSYGWNYQHFKGHRWRKYH